MKVEDHRNLFCRAKLNYKLSDIHRYSFAYQIPYHMKRELGSFVQLFDKYFPNLFSKKNFLGKVYREICVCYDTTTFKSYFLDILYAQKH